MSHARHRRAPGHLLRRLVTVALSVLVAGVLAPAAPAAADPFTEGQWWQLQWEMDDVWRHTDGSGITVAVLDSGVDPSIPELAGAVLPGTNLTGGDGLGDHGTWVASLIAGRGGDRGFQGVAPGASILPVTVAGPDVTGFESHDVLAQGIRYATDGGAGVINISLSAPGLTSDVDGCPEPILQAIRYAADNDVVVVAGSGNRAGGITGHPGSCPGVLTVGATDRQLNPWEQSHRSEYVDVTAAGVELTAIGQGGEATSYLNGTSFATALVSGAIALVRAQLPDDSADQILRRMLHTAGDIHTPGRDDATGQGVVQPIYALTEPLPPDAPNPIFDRLYEATGGEEPPAAGEPDELGRGAPMVPGAGGDSGGGIQPVALIGGALAVLVVGGIVLLVVVSRARRPRPIPPPHAPFPGPPGPYAGPPPPGPPPPVSPPAPPPPPPGGQPPPGGTPQPSGQPAAPPQWRAPGP